MPNYHRKMIGHELLYRLQIVKFDNFRLLINHMNTDRSFLEERNVNQYKI